MCIIDSPNLLSIFENETSQADKAAVITQHFGFEPRKDDPITNMICISCWTQIESFHTYYLNVEDAQRRFSQLYLEQKIKEESDKKEIELLPFDQGEINNYQEAEYPELHTNNKLADSGEKNCKYEIVAFAEGGEAGEEVGNDDNDDCYEPGADMEDIDNQSDSCDSSDEENKPIAQIRDETRQSLLLKINQNMSTIQETQVVSATSEGPDLDKASPKKRGRKKKSEKPAQTSPRTSEYRIKSKQYDEEIAKRTKLKCDLCEKEFAIFNVLQRHYRAEHKIKGYVVCCTTKFYKRGMFLDHIMKHLEPDRLRCDICKKTYCSRRALHDHILVYHAPGDVKTFQCDQCPRKYLKQYQLNIHKKKHIPKGASQYKCDECGKGFNTNNALQTHRRYIHENKYAHMCHICAKVLRSRTLYLKHKLVEHEGYVEPKQQCKECGAWLKNAFRLKLHMKKHKERESDFICNICGKSSPSSSALQSHVKYVHEAQRLHQCTFCDKAFKRPITLKEHLTTHTGDVLYTCPHCPKTFNSRANMHSHRKKKHPKEWEEARIIRGAPLRKFGKISSEETDQIFNDNSLENAENSLNEDCEIDAAYDSLKHMA